MEPLLLLAVVEGRAEQVDRLLKLDETLHSELLMLDRLQRADELESALDSGEPPLRVEYIKVWRSFTSRRDANSRDEELKLLARERALRLEETRGVTRYRMAKDLGLNPGNLHAFLAQGNVKKLSLDRAYQLVDYLESTKLLAAPGLLEQIHAAEEDLESGRLSIAAELRAKYSHKE